MARLECLTSEHAESREGRIVGGNRHAAYQTWYDRSEYLTRQKEETSDDLPDDELPPVVQFPIVGTVRTRFIEIGRYQPLPFPETDD